MYVSPSLCIHYHKRSLLFPCLAQAMSLLSSASTTYSRSGGAKEARHRQTTTKTPPLDSPKKATPPRRATHRSRDPEKPYTHPTPWRELKLTANPYRCRSLIMCPLTSGRTQSRKINTALPLIPGALPQRTTHTRTEETKRSRSPVHTQNRSTETSMAEKKREKDPVNLVVFISKHSSQSGGQLFCTTGRNRSRKQDTSMAVAGKTNSGWMPAHEQVGAGDPYFPPPAEQQKNDKKIQSVKPATPKNRHRLTKTKRPNTAPVIRQPSAC
ncbi:unnamed protein product [Ectocarpus sp. 6 AP-2014]